VRVGKSCKGEVGGRQFPTLTATRHRNRSLPLMSQCVRESNMGYFEGGERFTRECKKGNNQGKVSRKKMSCPDFL
jgi:hypothetical protein